MRYAIEYAEVQDALEAWLANQSTCVYSDLLKVSRFFLHILEKDYDGSAVEVRIPLAGAVQILEGAKHRRGTPPAVVEMDMQTWLMLCTGKISWEQGLTQNLIDRSGNRSDIGDLFPLDVMVWAK